MCISSLEPNQPRIAIHLNACKGFVTDSLLKKVTWSDLLRVLFFRGLALLSNLKKMHPVEFEGRFACCESIARTWSMKAALAVVLSPI